jgi:uncharacterized protein (TIGR03437 family)
MDRLRLRVLAAFVFALAFAATAWGDVTGTLTLSSGQQLSMSAGAIVSSGGDLQFTSTGISFLGGAKAFDLSGNNASAYPNFGLTEAQADASLMSSNPIPLSSLIVGNLFLMQDNAGSFAKVLVTASSAASISLQFDTFQSGAASAPTITNVENAAGEVSQGLPNAGIAQGSVFILVGTGMGPLNLLVSPAPFQSTSLGGTSVSITVGGASVNALMYYTSATQVAALLPSNTPVGTGTVSVTYTNNANTQVGAAVPISVVANNLGIFTVDSSGQGPGIVTYPDYSLVSAGKAAPCGGPYTSCGAANPGDVLILWATGLGAISGSDAAGAGLGQNMPNLPLKLWIGGVQAAVTYQGRSGCCIGEDQIVFTVPNNAPTGCAVPLLVQIGNQVSNNTVIPIANGSRNCTPSNPALSATLEQLVMAGTINVGSLKLSRDPASGGNGYTDTATLQFQQFAAYNQGSQPFFASYVDDQPLGTCLVYNNLNAKMNNPVIFSNSLNFGTSFIVTGPNGGMGLGISQGKTITTLSSTGTYLVPGSYTVTSNGGSDIGPINASVTIPTSSTLTIPNPTGAISPVTRSSGMTVSWTGGGAGSIVRILVTGATDSTLTNGATVYCEVPASAGTFTIPAYAMLTLPPGNFGALTFRQRTLDVPLTATGLNVGELKTLEAPVSVSLTLQ